MGIRTRKRFGVAIWLVGAAVAIAWGSQRSVTLEGRGLGYARTVSVSAVESGRIASLNVELHQQVFADSPVAQLDTTPLVEQQRIAAADLLAIQEQLSADQADRSRRFARGREGAMLDRAKADAQLTEARGRRAVLKSQIELERGLAETGAIAKRQVYELEWELENLELQIDSLAALTSIASTAEGQAAERGQRFTKSGEWRIASAVRRVEHVEGRIARLTLRAGIDGQVTWIHRHAGDVVARQEPVLEVAESAAHAVVGYLPSAVLGRVEIGSDARVVRANGQVLNGRVVSVGVDVRRLPEQLQRNPAAPEWGVPVRLDLLDGGAILRDEPVVLRL